MGCKIYGDENVCAKEGRSSARACVSEGGVGEDVKVTLARFGCVCVFLHVRYTVQQWQLQREQ